MQKAVILFKFSFVGYEEHTQTILLPLSNTDEVILIQLSSDEETRRSYHQWRIVLTEGIEAIPTRIEVLGAEELTEKSIMRSSNIAMLLRESTGIQMQQTSASSANQSIRIQGLDGRYTQLMMDGFPLYSGFAGGLRHHANYLH